jgi:AcrR family transcriptional regulator
VVRNQRSRLSRALTAAVEADGQLHLSVAGLCRLAGISKRTFYELYPNMDACVADVYDAIQLSAHARIEEVARGRDWEHGVIAIYESVGRLVGTSPDAARFVTLTPLAQGSALLARRRTARGRLGRVLIELVGRTLGATETRAQIADGIVAGTEWVIARHLEAGRLNEMGRASLKLADWVLSQTTLLSASSDELLHSPVIARQFPRSSRSMARSRVPALGGGITGGDRIRLLRATAYLLARDGYDGLSGERIASRAGLSKALWSGMYSDVDECLCDAVDLASLEALILTLKAVSVEEADREPDLDLYEGLATLLSYYESDPFIRRISCSEINENGRLSVVLRDRLAMRTLELAQKLLRSTLSPTGVKREATVGALWHVISSYCRSSEVSALDSAVISASYFTTVALGCPPTPCDRPAQVPVS